jgi:hypothetical protein
MNVRKMVTLANAFELLRQPRCKGLDQGDRPGGPTSRTPDPTSPYEQERKAFRDAGMVSDDLSSADHDAALDSCGDASKDAARAA